MKRAHICSTINALASSTICVPFQSDLSQPKCAIFFSIFSLSFAFSLHTEMFSLINRTYGQYSVPSCLIDAHHALHASNRTGQWAHSMNKAHTSLGAINTFKALFCCCGFCCCYYCAAKMLQCLLFVRLKFSYSILFSEVGRRKKNVTFHS